MPESIIRDCHQYPVFSSVASETPSACTVTKVAHTAVQYRANNWPRRGKTRHLSRQPYFLYCRLTHKAPVGNSPAEYRQKLQKATFPC
ncbi:unnamed protein product, partial [Iphiclides podalirius]